MRKTKHSMLFKTIIGIPGNRRNNAEFADAESTERDGRVTKHSTLLKTIIEITGITRFSA